MEEKKLTERPLSAPFFRLPETAERLSLFRLAALSVILVFALCFFGGRVPVLAFLGMLGASAAYALWQAASGKYTDLFSVSTLECGVMCALLMPVSVPVWLVMAASAFAVIAVEMPFGGYGRGAFSPPAAGGCLAVLLGARAGAVIIHNSANEEMFAMLPARVFDCVSARPPLFADVAGTGELADRLSPLMLLRAGQDPRLSAVQLLVGGQRGAMCAALLPLLLAGAVLCVTRTAAVRSMAAYLSGIAVLSFLMPYGAVDRIMSPVYDLLCGTTLFIGLFVIGDIFTSPHTRTGQVMYGLLAAVLSMWFRRRGGAECGELFAALFMGALSEPADRLVWLLRKKGLSFNEAKRAISLEIRKRKAEKEERG